MVQEQPGNHVVAPESDAVGLRNHTPEQGRVAPEHLVVQCCRGIWIRALVEEPGQGIDLVIVDA